MATVKQERFYQEQCDHCRLWSTNVINGLCIPCYVDLNEATSSCKLGTLDKDNCEVLECTCGHHKDKGGDPNVDSSC